MFGIWKRRKPEVLKRDHWTFDNFECSPSEFYKSIEREFAARSIPGLSVEHIAYKEGGLLSANRDYLRIQRERLVFDICLAQFGVHWFISRRYSLIPFNLHAGHLLVLLFLLSAAALFYISLFDFTLGLSLFGATLLGLILLLRNVVTMGLHDLDSALLQVPVLGAIYESFFRKETYFREDTRSAYLVIVDAVLKAKIDELIEEKDAQLVSYVDETPPERPSILSMIALLLKAANR